MWAKKRLPVSAAQISGAGRWRAAKSKAKGMIGPAPLEPPRWRD